MKTQKKITEKAKEPVYKHNIGSTTDFKVEAKEVKSAEELYCIKFKFPKSIIPHLDRKRDVTLKLSSIFDLMNEFANQYKVK